MNIAEIAERLKAYEELDRQIKHEKLRILEAAKEKSRTETKSSPTIRYPSGSNHSDRISRQLENASRIYAETSSFLDGYRRVLADSDASVKQVRVQIKMHINKKVGQVCNSLRQMVSIINNSLAAFNEAWTAKGPDMMHFAVTIMASKILVLGIGLIFRIKLKLKWPLIRLRRSRLHRSAKTLQSFNIASSLYSFASCMIVALSVSQRL